MNISSTKKLGIALILLLIICGAGYTAGVLLARWKAVSSTSFAVIDSCFTKKDQTSGCLKTTVSALLKNNSVQEVMTYVTASTTSKTVVNSCHAIGHIVGALAYQKFGSIEEALGACSNACRSACTHGVIGAGVLAQMGEPYPDDDIAHADRAELEILGKRYCKNSDSICHGIGHVAYIATENDVRALQICDTVAATALRREACYQGVFMERAGSFINVLFPGADKIPPVEAGNYTYPCATIPQQYHNACFMFLNAYQKLLFKKDGLISPEERLQKATHVCQSLSAHDRADCFTGIGISSDLFGFEAPDADNMQSLCDQFSSISDRDACTLGVIPRFLYPDFRGIHTYCGNIGETSRKALCYDAAFQWFHAKFGDTREPATMCGSDRECMAGLDRFEQERGALPDYRFGLYGISAATK